MTVRKTNKCFRLKRNKHRDGFHPLLSLCQYCLSNVLVTSQLPLCFWLSRLRHRHPHSQMHYWKNKLLSLPCCELCWVMSESLSPPDSCRVSASYFFLPFGVQLGSALHLFLFCFTPALSFSVTISPLLFIIFPFLFGLFQFHFHKAQTLTHAHIANREGVCCIRFFPPWIKSHWSLSLLTEDDKVPFSADAQKGQGCRCIFAWGIE